MERLCKLKLDRNLSSTVTLLGQLPPQEEGVEFTLASNAIDAMQDKLVQSISLCTACASVIRSNFQHSSLVSLFQHNQAKNSCCSSSYTCLWQSILLTLHCKYICVCLSFAA